MSLNPCMWLIYWTFPRSDFHCYGGKLCKILEFTIGGMSHLEISAREGSWDMHACRAWVMGGEKKKKRKRKKKWLVMYHSMNLYFWSPHTSLNHECMDIAFALSPTFCTRANFWSGPRIERRSYVWNAGHLKASIFCSLILGLQTRWAKVGPLVATNVTNMWQKLILVYILVQ